MPVTATILEAIKATVLSSYEYKCDKTQNIITLTEDHQYAICREVKLQITDEILIYKFDRVVRDQENQEISHPLLFLEPTKPIRSTCDYLLFYLKETRKGKKKLYVVVCNLKSETKGNMEEQMAAGGILAEFITKTAFRCHKSWNSSTPNKLQEDFTIKELAFYHKLPNSVAIPKGKSKTQNNIPQRANKRCDEIYSLNLLCD